MCDDLMCMYKYVDFHTFHTGNIGSSLPLEKPVLSLECFIFLLFILSLPFLRTAHSFLKFFYMRECDRPERPD